MASLSPTSTGLERAQARTELALAASDYASTFPKENPALHLAVKRVRAEQVALMPLKPSDGERGADEYAALAKARHRLASASAACWDSELQGIGAEDASQAVYDEAVFRVVRAEMAFRDTAWSAYDVTAEAEREVDRARLRGDRVAMRRAEGVLRLARDSHWGDSARQNALAVRGSGDYRAIRAAEAERESSEEASRALVALLRRSHPHALLRREAAGEEMPPAPWIGGATRALDPCDTPQLRHLCEGECTSVSWDRASSVVIVRDVDHAAVRRLWAYGYFTEPSSDLSAVRVSRAPALGKVRLSSALRKVT